MSRRLAVLLCVSTALLLAAVALDVTPLLRGPAPYPPEWQWGVDPKPVHAARLAPVLLCGGALLGLLWAPVDLRSRGVRGAWLLVAVLLGWGLQLALLGLEREGARAELTRRTESGSFTSYYTVATRGPGRDAADFVARHHQLLPGLRKGTPHAATHPPGPVLFYRALAVAHDRWAFLRDRVTVPVLGAALLGLLGAAAAFPVAVLGGWLSGDAAAGFRLGLLWLFVPGVALMVPQFDQALALLVAGALAALARGLAAEADVSRGWLLCVAAGFLAGAGFFVSYGAASLIVVGALGVLAAVMPAQPPVRVLRGLAVATVAALAVVLLPALWEHAPWRSLPVALSIHREQFTAPRSYLAWLVFNPLDLALFLGLPVALAGLARLGEVRAPDTRFCLGVTLGLVLLFLSGTLRGESGRILIPLMPALLVAALARPVRPARGEALLVGALLLCIDVVLRLSWRLP